LWRNGGQPLFSKMGVEAQLDAMLSPTVQLRSGGYLVINQTEALVAIDVNSGRATRERGIEETALRTNLEAVDEVGRQLRLRDLAGLIVIDLIDMEARKHNAMVERRMKDALKNDRARIQLGHISHFGLLEMSRQRLRPSLAETSLVVCPHCRGLGRVRGVESAAIHVLRGIEEEGAKARAGLIMVHVAEAIAMYLLNNKRDRLGEIEARYAMRVHFTSDDTLPPPEYRIDRLKPPLAEAERSLVGPVAPAAPATELADENAADEIEAAPELLPEAEAPDAEVEPAAPAAQGAPDTAEARAAAEENERRRRRRRRRRGGRREAGEAEAPRGAGEEREEADQGPVSEVTPVEAVASEAELAFDLAGAEQPVLEPADLDENGLPRSRRRGRRGGRRRHSPRDDLPEAAREPEPVAVEAPPEPAYIPVPAYTGPTPAEPFGRGAYDIFDVIEQAEEQPDVVVEPMPAPAMVMAAPEPEPAPELILAAATPLVPEPVVAVSPPAEAEPEPGPAVRPIVIGRDPIPEVERKRGWWRR
jgi:ribonuclease E